MSVVFHSENTADDRRPASAGAAGTAANAVPAEVAVSFSPAQATPCPLRQNSKVNEVSA